MIAERKYVLTKVAVGDYLLPSNDGKTIWRIHRYTEGPTTGLDWPRDRDVWGVWRWPGGSGRPPELDLRWDHWQFWEGLHATRAEAVNAALAIRNLEGQ